MYTLPLVHATWRWIHLAVIFSVIPLYLLYTRTTSPMHRMSLLDQISTVRTELQYVLLLLFFFFLKRKKTQERVAGWMNGWNSVVGAVLHISLDQVSKNPRTWIESTTHIQSMYGGSLGNTFYRPQPLPQQCPHIIGLSLNVMWWWMCVCHFDFNPSNPEISFRPLEWSHGNSMAIDAGLKIYIFVISLTHIDWCGGGGYTF